MDLIVRVDLWNFGTQNRILAKIKYDYNNETFFCIHLKKMQCFVKNTVCFLQQKKYKSNIEVWCDIRVVL